MRLPSGSVTGRWWPAPTLISSAGSWLIPFEATFGRRPKLGQRKCERDRYKRILARTIREAGYPTVLGGLEFAEEIVAAMDLYRAGKREKSLKHFVDAARTLLAG